MRGKVRERLLISSIKYFENQLDIQLFARVKNINIASKRIFESVASDL